MKTFFAFCALGIALFSVAGCGSGSGDPATMDPGRVETVSPATIDATVSTTFPTTVGTDTSVPAYARLYLHGPGIARNADTNPRYISIRPHDTDPLNNCGPCFTTGKGDDDLECHLLASDKDAFNPNIPHIVRVIDGSEQDTRIGSGPTVTFINYLMSQ